MRKERNSMGVSRRSFVKWSSVIAGATLSSGLVACKKSTAPAESTAKAEAEVRSVPYEVLEGGEWRCGSCWLPCGGSCVNKAYVKDGIVLQQTTDSFGEDNMDSVQQRSCARGRSLRHLVYGPDRIKYPLKRKNWKPGGKDFKGELRGVDEWVRISWEEALQLVASEVKRISDTYGGQSIYMPGRNASPSLASYKGYANKWGGRSYGGAYFPGLKMCGFEGWPFHALTLPDRYEYQNSKLIILWGHNPTWSAQCNSIRNFQAAKEAGARIIVVDPYYHDSAKVLDAEFIPVRPSEDVPLLLALAYEMITNKLHDQAFLDKYTVGFDKDHMPKGANPKDSFNDYVLGTYDGIPKTPEWATKYCGTPVEMIRSLARDMATTKPMALTASRAAARVSNGEEFTQAFFTVGWMTGNVGKPGACVGHVVTSNVGSGNSGPALVSPGNAGIPGYKNPISSYRGNEVDPFDKGDWYSVCTSVQWKTILEKKNRLGIRGVQPHDIRMIAHMNQADNFNAGPDVLLGIKAHRAVDFVLSCALTMDTRSTYADIVLPAATPWETGIMPVMRKFSKEALIANQKITAPIFETRPDIEIEAGIAAALGSDPKRINPFGEEIHTVKVFATTMVMGADGKTKEPLFTITEADIPDGADVKPQQGKITIQQFYKDGLYKVKRSKGDNYGFIPFKEFIDDPVANPLKTPSGKLEIHCQSLADIITVFGYSVKEPIAKYGHFEEGWIDTYSNWDKQIKGDYPLMGLSLHGYRTVHSTFDNVPQIREAFPNNLRINPVDANARGIKDGETVLISSRWGKTLRKAMLTERVMPGVIMMDQTMLANVDPKTGIDDAGCFNVLTGSLVSGGGIQVYGSCNVQIAKWTGAAIVDDCLRPQRIVEA